ncbi:MAG: YdeI/OmpD-associated family protein [Dehalococcoidia bacterium]
MTGGTTPEPRHFRSAADFRRWLTRHADDTAELLVGFYTKASDRGGLTYAEAVDEALCFGWIDGVRRKGAADEYVQRFSPRRRRSRWSAINLRRFEEMRLAGRVAPRGLEVFQARDTAADGFSIAARPREIDATVEQRLREHAEAWSYFEAQPPSYRRDAAWWVMDAKREATRERRLETLLADSAAGRRIAPLTSPSRRQQEG